MSPTQLILSVMNLPLSDMEALYKSLPYQINLRKLESAHEQTELEAAESNARLFGLSEPVKPAMLSTGKSNAIGRPAKPLSAGSLLKEFFSLTQAASRQDVISFCQAQNSNLNVKAIDAGAHYLVQKGFLTKYNGTWRRVG